MVICLLIEAWKSDLLHKGVAYLFSQMYIFDELTRNCVESYFIIIQNSKTFEPYNLNVVSDFFTYCKSLIIGH